MIARLVGPSQFSYARNERIGRLEKVLSCEIFAARRLALTPLYSVRRLCLEVAMQVVLGGITLLVLGVGAQLSDDLSQEQLKPLTAFRQQRRRLVRLRPG